ncbi:MULTISPECIES: iron ABC transporter substrate-binding protein [unclassified Methylobacterium]|jgi:iron complex transport system substrate-binding protein|uniref:iron ABC transporter substrate-binding protein n=1 Tax=unclassified Methylobacterium TaxID=2615210 RepID=UPI0013555F17|nr:iron ABC transporter substrate-binding protein [Methylobacterium sp. 2A]MWV25644.1 iron ABC transporter substrate-binding protein [Methylobacterium sp. 2A]
MRSWVAYGRSFAGALLACLALAHGAAARPFTDAAGRTVELPDRIERVLAAGPPAAVLLYTLAPDRMAGWVSAPRPEALPFLDPRTRTLPAYGRLTGRGGTANVEAVLAAKPDLIVDSGSLGPTYASLADRVQAQTGIPYILLDGSFARMPETYRQLGAALGRQAEADALAASAEALMGTVAKAVGPIPEARRPGVYYARGPRGLETGFAGSINTEVLEAAGGRNVAQAGDGRLGAVSPEQILAWNPDVIVTLDPAFAAAVRTEPLWRDVRAVQTGRIYLAPQLPFPWFDAPPGVNRLIGLRWLAGLLYPERFPQPMSEGVRDFYHRFYHVDLDAAQAAALLAPPDARH